MKLKEMIPFLQNNMKNIKVHCAIGRKNIFDPRDSFTLGNFKEWQEHQTKKNFARDYILSMVYTSKNEWLFVGIYKSISVKEHPTKNGFKYDTELTDIGKEYIGKAVFSFKKEFRQSYLCLEKYIDDFELIEMYREPLKPRFPGYDKIDINWENLSKWIITDSWKTALENQKGVYLITDTNNGKKYIGSAYGKEMIFGRWSSYIQTGHGGNIELKRFDFEYIKENFKYSILEIFKASTEDEVILERESWWKDVLMTRNTKYGYNKN